MKFKLKKKNIKLSQKIIVLAIIISSTLALSSFIKVPQNSFSDAVDHPGYVDFSIAKTTFSNQKNVLFFKANWCSTCELADLNFMSQIRSIPSYLTIYRVDFEHASDLRKKYFVTAQHTFVQVDSDGNALKKWEGSYTIDEIITELV